MTTPPVSTTRQRQLLEELRQLVVRRAHEEQDINRARQERDARSREQYEADQKRLTAEHREETERLRSEYADAMDRVIASFDEQRQTLSKRFEGRIGVIKTEADKAMKSARRDRLLAKQQATEQYQQTIEKPRQELSQFQATCDQYQAELAALDAHARGILARRRCAGLAGIAGQDEDSAAGEAVAPEKDTEKTPEKAPEQSAEKPTESPLERYGRAVAAARQHLHEMASQRTAKFIEEGWPILLFLFLTLAAAYPCILLFGWSGWHWIAATAGTGFVLTLVVTAAIYPFIRRQTARTYPVFEHRRQEAAQALADALLQARRGAQGRERAITRKRDHELEVTEAKWERVSSQITNDRDTRLHDTTTEFDQQKQRLIETRDGDLQKLNEKYPPLLEQHERQYREAMQQRQTRHEAELAASRERYEAQWNELVQFWTTGVDRFREAVGEMNAYCDRHFADWETIDWDAWKAPDLAVESLRLGSYTFDLARLESGLSEYEDLQVQPTRFELPACLSFPDCPSLLMQASDAGRDAAVRALQNVMLRLLTSAPAAKVRFTIIDPTGLGQNFSAFMHLADFDDKLVTNRIWTESGHINQRLLDLTEHMEKVIQKYLRNEFVSIQQYNEHAGEVAEPFQILVVANFPAGFSEEAARRLVSIAGSGPRCGVYTLISTDQKLSLPRNFDLADLEAHAATLVWQQDQFRWKEPELGALPLQLDEPPGDDAFTSAVKAAGLQAKDSSRVEVPFAKVVPDPGEWWTADSCSEVEVPLGRAGATKFQFMRLGRGTSQHVLISGKTGSGKSTLLHAMITNLALHYSPREVEFYLIDFKKGVEFRPYAALGLPHARVIAIESEREFGMSVLERLDEELKRRGDLFRAEGVQNVAGFRDANPDRIMPRVLLIIDEFQELFVKDDRLAQDASLLLDRLVRQGRAFGIHVLLGSQTLAGAYSLARSTIGQMAVRIALQCSEADAHLILSEDNTAARLLSRPGEAIYNDANGLMEGNHPFQVVWLPDAEREYYLRELSARARAAEVRMPSPIVFEGNVAADPSKNVDLNSLLESTPETLQAPQAWLGAAVAIKEPTSAVFRRHSGSNLLLVGQQEEMALGVLSTALISLAAQLPTSDAARFYLLDGTHPDAPQAEFWGSLASRLPLPLHRASPRGVAESVSEIAAELERRMEASNDSAAPVFLIIHNLARFRDLKKSDDDFGFSMSGDEEATASPGKQLTSLLRDGPSYGIHALIWCDTYNNLNRWIDRQTLRDLEMRALFQMGATDSSNLMDSPEASRLGVHRAILYSEELGQWEKFRPYGPPDDQWLGWVRRKLEHRWLQTPTP